MPLSTIQTEDEVFIRDGETGVGAVRMVRPDTLVVHFEGYGEVEIGPDQIASAHDGKVMVKPDTLPGDLQARLDHIHDGEFRNPSDQGGAA
ncbi:hypothetical protein JSE7799_00479 [Jannaschia seosinensis]|uniref:DUF2171 domain-containing protein n=1 Tax=Jannaschia seosinensis TaxID=313367 RepID=A0A0M7B627_9RHOB|nr:hypothetical protein [Jannaschia seosinensis]CUH19465.1 hypothetical protein JSE7799_00479 [Jannaschia seosinensis]